MGQSQGVTLLRRKTCGSHSSCVGTLNMERFRILRHDHQRHLCADSCDGRITWFESILREALWKTGSKQSSVQFHEETASRILRLVSPERGGDAGSSSASITPVDHLYKVNFRETTKTRRVGSKGGKTEIRDVELTRYACYMVVLSSDSSKPMVGLAKDYFAEQTRRQGLSQCRTVCPALRRRKTPHLPRTTQPL